MGCQQSTPVEKNPASVTAPRKASVVAPPPPARQKSAQPQKKRPMGVGATERLASNRKKKLSSVLGGIEEGGKPKLNGSGQLMPEEVVKRTFCSIKNSHVALGRPGQGNVVKVTYAYWTQRGYYPDAPNKANQDDYGITLKFAGEENDALFCVYDGHGGKGHDCARYARKKVPKTMEKYVRQKRVKAYQDELKAAGRSTKGSFNPAMWPKLSVGDYEEACRKSLVEVNKKMHDDDEVDDKLSGTTAIVVGFHFGRMTVCNVGDSRVVMGHLASGGADVGREEEKTEEGEEPSRSAESTSLVAIPFSSDQTPYRRDERERVRKAGADVMSMDQMEGDAPMHDNWDGMVLGEDIDFAGDPPRVWCKGCDYPGCAFTRSIGDELADDVGVIAEPEIITKELTPSDRILVIASDGIFEFLTNQAVIDLCAECATPLEACESIVKQAYNQWLKHEDRTDDITAIVCFLDVVGDPPKDATGSTDELLAEGTIALAGQKPIRIRDRTKNGLNNSMKQLPDNFLQPSDKQKKESASVDLEIGS